MKRNSQCIPSHIQSAGLAVGLAVAFLAEGFLCTSDVQAQLLAYSFETDQGGPDGFQTNTGGTYTQDTIGATLAPIR